MNERLQRVRIRVARSKDVEHLARIQLRSSLRAYARIFPIDAPRPTIQMLIPGWARAVATDAALVALDADEVAIGGVIAAPSEVVANGEVVAEGEISRLYVDPSWWSRRIGSELLTAALARLRAGGAVRASLWVLEKNMRAREMYERRGWTLARGMTNPIHHGVVEVRYELTL